MDSQGLFYNALFYLLKKKICLLYHKHEIFSFDGQICRVVGYMKVVKISTGGLKCSTWTWENIFKGLMQNSALEDEW